MCEPAERSFFCQDVHSSAYRDVVMPCDSDSDDYNFWALFIWLKNVFLVFFYYVNIEYYLFLQLYLRLAYNYLNLPIKKKKIELSSFISSLYSSSGFSAPYNYEQGVDINYQQCLT